MITCGVCGNECGITYFNTKNIGNIELSSNHVCEQCVNKIDLCAACCEITLKSELNMNDFFTCNKCNKKYENLVNFDSLED